MPVKRRSERSAALIARCAPICAPGITPTHSGSANVQSMWCFRRVRDRARDREQADARERGRDRLLQAHAQPALERRDHEDPAADAEQARQQARGRADDRVRTTTRRAARSPAPARRCSRAPATARTSAGCRDVRYAVRPTSAAVAIIWRWPLPGIDVVASEPSTAAGAPNAAVHAHRAPQHEPFAVVAQRSRDRRREDRRQRRADALRAVSRRGRGSRVSRPRRRRRRTWPRARRSPRRAAA